MEEYQQKKQEEITLVKEEKRKMSKQKRKMEEDQYKQNVQKREDIMKSSEVA